jgi:tRNA A22 N-methylase
MYILQIKQPTDTWIVGISQHEEDLTEYLATLSAEIQVHALLFEITFKYYPFIIIQNTLSSQDSDSYFEFCDFETLQSRINAKRLEKIESEDHIYFKYYYISEPYAQMVTDENWMQYLRHTCVTNSGQKVMPSKLNY